MMIIKLIIFLFLYLKFNCSYFYTHSMYVYVSVYNAVAVGAAGYIPGMWLPAWLALYPK